MAKNSFEQNGTDGFPEMSEFEKETVREIFLTTVSEAIRQNGNPTVGGHDRVRLGSAIGNQELVLITIGRYTGERGPTGIITMYRLTGERARDTTAYEPDDETGYIIRRELTLENRRKITEQLLDVLDENPNEDEEGLLTEQARRNMVDDYAKVETIPGSGRRELPLVWPEEMRWLAEVVHHAVPRR